jgi:hypothetical protein
MIEPMIDADKTIQHVTTTNPAIFDLIPIPASRMQMLQAR